MLSRARHPVTILIALLAAGSIACSLFSVLQQKAMEEAQEAISESAGLPAPLTEPAAEPEAPATAPQQGAGAPETGPEAPGVPTLVEQGTLELQGIQATQEEISGPVLALQISNPTDGEVVASIPCGFIFLPADQDEQRMMVIQPIDLSLAPGESGELRPYVICIDGDKAGPSTGSTYLLGTMATDDLLKLAQCVCQEDLTALEESLDPFKAIGLQIAVWMTSSGVDSLEEMMLSGGEGAFGSLMGDQFGDMGEEMQQFIQMLSSMIEEPAQEWLQRCEITPK